MKRAIQQSRSAGWHHGVILAPALLAGVPGSVIRLRQLSIRSDRPVEQVGEHHGGAGGCLASGDSGGIRAGASGGGGELGAFVAQPRGSNACIDNFGFFIDLEAL